MSEMLTKLKKLIHLKIFILTFLFGIVFEGIGYLRVHLFRIFGLYGDTFAQHQFYAIILGVVRNVLIPILMFVVLYRLGKDIVLRSAYISVSVSLFIGGAFGPFFRCFVDQLISPDLWWDSWAGQLYLTAVQAMVHALRQFFLGFTALALAYLRNREGPSEGVR